MLIHVQINFSVFDPRGWVVGMDCNARLDPSLPLDEQASREAVEVINRKNRIHGTNLRLSNVISAFIEYRGFWYTSEKRDSSCKLEWPKAIP